MYVIEPQMYVKRFLLVSLDEIDTAVYVGLGVLVFFNICYFSMPEFGTLGRKSMVFGL